MTLEGSEAKYTDSLICLHRECVIEVSESSAGHGGSRF